MSAISENEFWVLGRPSCTVTCATSSVRHTTDGGRHYDTLPSPAIAGYPAQGTVWEMRFANASDGWAWGGQLWATHDGGRHWRLINAFEPVRQVEPGAGGVVYALGTVGPCGSAGPCNATILKSDVTRDAWNPVALPQPTIDFPASIGVHGDSLWVMAGGLKPGLWHSNDRGRSFTKYSDPCYPDLGGSLSPASDTVIWAYCASGMQGAPRLSTNGGRTFTDVSRVQGSPNSATLAALSDRKAFISTVGSAVWRTTDGGSTYQSALTDAGQGQLEWVGFTDSQVGYVIEFLPRADTDGKDRGRLWRTTDGGLTWSIAIGSG
jgi:photosystem II stability/assembly factor-like uncharacterized protein